MVIFICTKLWKTVHILDSIKHIQGMMPINTQKVPTFDHIVHIILFCCCIYKLVKSEVYLMERKNPLTYCYVITKARKDTACVFRYNVLGTVAGGGKQNSNCLHTENQRKEENIHGK
jgi:hypothetical protein